MTESVRLHLHPLRVLLIGGLMGMIGCANPGRVSAPNAPELPFSKSGNATVPDRWWTAFDDRALNEQVEQALGGNLTLATAFHRIRSARALAKREASDLLPDVDGFIDLNKTFNPGPNRTRFALGLDTAYQVDLWGQIQSRVDAERLRASASESDFQAATLSVAAEVARTW